MPRGVRVYTYSLFRSMREISATVRSNAQLIMVAANIATAIPTDHNIGLLISMSMKLGAMIAPNVQNRPRIRIISALFTNTPSRKLYLALGMGAALA